MERDEAAKIGRVDLLSFLNCRGKIFDLQKSFHSGGKSRILSQRGRWYQGKRFSARKSWRRILFGKQRIKAQIILEDAESSAKKLMDNAKLDAAKAAKDYMAQAENKKNELEEIKRQVSAFQVPCWKCTRSIWSVSIIFRHFAKRNSLLRLLKKNPPVRPAEKQEPEREIQEEPEFEEQPGVVSESSTQDDTSEEEALQRQQMSFEEALSYEAHEPTLHDRINYAQEQAVSTDTNFPADDDLTDVGIDVRAYSDIPETLRKEKVLISATWNLERDWNSERKSTKGKEGRRAGKSV